GCRRRFLFEVVAGCPPSCFLFFSLAAHLLPRPCFLSRWLCFLAPPRGLDLALVPLGAWSSGGCGLVSDRDFGSEIYLLPLTFSVHSSPTGERACLAECVLGSFRWRSCGASSSCSSGLRRRVSAPISPLSEASLCCFCTKPGRSTAGSPSLGRVRGY
ncbi:unnamed protein product, partial [Brassica rapa subsp. narinosa]